MKNRTPAAPAPATTISPAMAGEISALMKARSDYVHAASTAAWWGVRSRVERKMYWPFGATEAERLPLTKRIAVAARAARDAYSPRRVPGSLTMYVLVSDGWYSPSDFALCRGKEVIGIFPITEEGFILAERAL